MVKTKKRIGVWTLILSILFILLAILFIFAELFSFSVYINSLPGPNSEGRNVFGVIVIGICAGIAIALCGIADLVFSIIILKSNKTKILKTMTILGAVVKLIGVVIAVWFSVTMANIYPDILLVVYLPVAAGAIVTSVFDFIGCRKFKEEIVPEAIAIDEAIPLTEVQEFEQE